MVSEAPSSTSIEFALQEMQGDKHNLEKQLRIVKQERNALAVTLRQHGFLGKQTRSDCAVQAATHAQQKAHTDVRRNSGQDSIGFAKYGDSDNSNDVIRPSLGSANSRQQAPEPNDLKATPSPRLHAANASHVSHPWEARCLKDMTNVGTSTSTSPAAKSSTQQAAQMQQRSGSGAEMAASPMHAIRQAEAMQARLHGLEQLAKELLL